MSEIPIHSAGHGHSPLSGAGKKVGPLPVWGWGLLLGAVAVAYLWMHNQSATAANATPVDPSQTQPDASGSVSDPGLANDLSALQESVDSIQTAQTNLNKSNAEQTKQLTNQEKQIKNLQHHKHPPKHHKHDPHPHGGQAAKPHHDSKRKHPHVSGGK